LSEANQHQGGKIASAVFLLKAQETDARMLLWLETIKLLILGRIKKDATVREGRGGSHSIIASDRSLTGPIIDLGSNRSLFWLA